MNSPNPLAPKKSSGLFTDFDAQKESLDIDEAKIRDHFVEIPAQIAFAGSTCAMLGREASNRHYIYKQQRALLKERLRADASVKGERVTESRLDAMVEADYDILNWYNSYIEAQEEYELAKAHLDGLRTKRDMLINLGAHLRTEMQTMGMSQLGEG